MSRAVPLFLLADFTSVLGNSFIAIALPWFVLERTGDPASAGIVAASTAAPAALAAFVGGWLVDRVGRRRMSILSDLGSAAAVAAIPFVDATVGLTLGWFVTLGVLGALFDVPGMTARESLLPDVGRAGGIPLDRLSGIRESLLGVATLAGPALAGLALTLWGESIVLLVTATTSAVAAGATLLIPRGVGARGERSGPRETLAAQLLGGLQVLRRNRTVLALTVLSCGSIAVVGPLQALLLPMWFSAADAPGFLGLTLSALALGTICGSLAYGAAAARLSRRGAYLICLAVITVGMLMLSTLHSPVVLMAAMFVCGFGSGLLAPIVPVVVAHQVPDSLRGRVFGIQNALVMIVHPVAIGGAALLTEVGPATAFLGVAGVWVLVAAYGVLVPGMKNLDDAKEMEPADAHHRPAG
ncbi:MFS transporter [Microbacterium sp. Marseille-Q6965]|uniref:MFS transporter n=1 Tax=Microbacterium sp. Marseille-Q6965 TaxID=2965072 RepID=UPI0021B7B08D|nr:MFS transporter [Microbacterium sp. Marseille-Q6965]